MLGGLLMSAPVWLFMGMGWDWLPGKPYLVMAGAGTLMIVGGLILWEDISEMLAAAPTPKKPEEIEKRLLRMETAETVIAVAPVTARWFSPELRRV
jgi:divalent metal cation (Fe/Co/Zn/Cd) transporter